MGKFIGVAKTHVEHLGMVLLKGLHGITEGKCIITFFSPVSRHCILHLVQEFCHGSVGQTRFVLGTAGETSPVIVDCEADGSP